MENMWPQWLQHAYCGDTLESDVCMRYSRIEYMKEEFSKAEHGNIVFQMDTPGCIDHFWNPHKLFEENYKIQKNKTRAY